MRPITWPTTRAFSPVRPGWPSAQIRTSPPSRVLTGSCWLNKAPLVRLALLARRDPQATHRPAGTSRRFAVRSGWNQRVLFERLCGHRHHQPRQCAGGQRHGERRQLCGRRDRLDRTQWQRDRQRVHYRRPTGGQRRANWKHRQRCGRLRAIGRRGRDERQDCRWEHSGSGCRCVHVWRHVLEGQRQQWYRARRELPRHHGQPAVGVEG